MDNVQTAPKKTNRGPTNLLQFVVFTNWLVVLFMVLFGAMLLQSLYAPLGLLILLFALIKGILTMGLMVFDNGSRVIDAILSLILFVFLLSPYTFGSANLFFYFPLIQFCILIFHPSTVRLFH
ncbi:MAG: hypothetical protein ACW99A_09740 [Candidatus Kariarchaeaceae archaeon]